MRLVNADPVAPLDQVGLGDAAPGISQQPVVLFGRDHPLVDRPFDGLAGLGWRGIRDQAALPHHGKARAQDGHVLDDVGRQENDPVGGQLGEQAVESQAFLGIEPGRRLVDDDQSRVAGNRLGDPQALRIPPE